jgi:AraC-like DNA-binding protein
MPSAAAWLDHLWAQQVGSSSVTHRRLPSGRVRIVLEAHCAPQVHGAQTRASLEVLAAGTTRAGLELRPDAASQVLGVPASEFVDRTFSLDELWPDRRVASLDESSPRAQLRRLLDLLARNAEQGHCDRAVTGVVRALENAPSTTVGDLAVSAGLSPRQLRRRMSAATGLSPKQLAGILRLHRFLALTQHADGIDLGTGAVLAGFADQPHLTRTATRLVGSSPAMLVADTAAACRHGHDHMPTHRRAIGPAARWSGGQVEPRSGDALTGAW